MSLARLQSQVEPVTRTDKVLEAIDALREMAANGATINGRHTCYPHGAAEEYEALKVCMEDEVVYGHQAVANAFVNLGFNLDRRQIHNFREKLKLGKVTL